MLKIEGYVTKQKRIPVPYWELRHKSVSVVDYLENDRGERREAAGPRSVGEFIPEGFTFKYVLIARAEFGGYTMPPTDNLGHAAEEAVHFEPDDSKLIDDEMNGRGTGEGVDALIERLVVARSPFFKDAKIIKE